MEGEGLFGFSIALTVAIFACGAAATILLVYIAYKYATWRPKMVARKGYRAVSKSKGLAAAESERGSDSSLRSEDGPSIIIAGNR